MIYMARKKSRMYKQISNVHLETVNDAPDWSSFLKLEKQDASMRSAYIDRVRISFVGAADTDKVAGLLFVASHDNALNSTTPSVNDGNVISASASRGAGGVVTLDIKRKITMDYDSGDTAILELLAGSSGAPVYLHIRSADPDNNRDVYLVVETWGRWFSATSL